MIVNGVPDDRTSLDKHFVSDSDQTNKVFNHIGVKTEDKTSSVKRPGNDSRGRNGPRPLLDKFNIAWECENCLPRFTY